MNKQSIFVSYSHKDGEIMTQLSKFIRVTMQREVTPFSDQNIAPGATWRDALQRAMAEASVAILIVSIDALDSECIRKEELPTLLKRREEEGLTIIPVIVRPCPWDKVPELEGLNSLPKDGQPLFNGRRDPYQIEEEMTAIARFVAEALDPAHAVESEVVARSPRPTSHTGPSNERTAHTQ
jgi:hypothetical protein